MHQSQLPADLAAALDGSGLTAFFDRFPASHRAEYLRWIDEAKRQETRATRISKTIEALLVKRGPAR